MRLRVPGGVSAPNRIQASRVDVMVPQSGDGLRIAFPLSGSKTFRVVVPSGGAGSNYAPGIMVGNIRIDTDNFDQLRFSSASMVFTAGATTLTAGGGSGENFTMTSQSGDGVIIRPATAAKAGALIRLQASPTGNALSVQTSTPTTIASIGADGSFRPPDGTAALPGLTWFNDTDTGIRRVGEDDMAFQLGGANEIMRLTRAASVNKWSVFGAPAVAQQAGIVDADGTLADITTKFNALLAKMEAYGLLAVA